MWSCALQIWDARLFEVGGEVWLTYSCSGCLFSVSQLQVSVEEGRMRAWALGWRCFQQPYLQGRNQVGEACIERT